ncbi:winged helix-turn-helix transcriptional regulator [Prosthecomicrobium pneumaticum]|uniref:DNA-binding HxlR family transcriptional regulator n=1 Tax=Prosthecomicrobium pneumaticum TaxID=81895 RepID=A0A7W9FP83_9HYPH|nr:helix-turn-helix domain-containing protein [Prosthecomicrobium pneumaticum]MBB5754354.1 DNA-binding HxlR family transcriptional regulator [Prosthecomicrobium pneumaticum]
MAYTEEDVLRTLPGVRPVLEQVAHKWTILILTFLCEEPKRFNALKRRLDGITQKALTDALRRLERNGLVERRVIASSPVAVEYAITPLGRGLQEPFLLLYDWAVEHQSDLATAQARFDRRAEGRPG